ncbi:MAG: 3,4-dihydroxy-2-butanone-4-phosphate synthase, partial [Candidatus Diapherotrites archaeon]|nr:3,4-dihydroxy-2-butanone-4-phosphate synthase [Candidatus Diapherotrites archaeon]
MRFDSISAAISDLKRGRFVIVVDAQNRENEGDLVLASEFATAQKLNFMVTNCRGLLCAPITAQKALQLELPMMTVDSTDTFQTPFTLSVDPANGSSGISVQNRLRALRILLSDTSKPSALSRPGHLFPLVGRSGGVLERTGHTEAALDLLSLAKRKPVGIICEILDERGEPANAKRLGAFARKNRFRIVSIQDLIAYRLKQSAQI